MFRNGSISVDILSVVNGRLKEMVNKLLAEFKGPSEKFTNLA